MDASKNPIASLNGVYALVYRNKKIWGKLISGPAAEDLEKMMNESAGKTIPWSSILDGYAGVITKKRLYYLNMKGKQKMALPSGFAMAFGLI